MDRSGQPSRRDFLRMTAEGALAGAVGLPLLAACTTATSGGAGPVSQATLPAYVPFKGPKPDFPATASGVEAGYSAFPKNLVRSVRQTPGNGEPITALIPAYTQPPTPMGQNAYWQAINKEAGVTFNPTITPAPDYPTKLNTVVSGGDLPDFIQFPLSVPFKHFPQFIKASCTDLTPHLAGDAVKQYPNLANIPTFAWKTVVVDGRIYGLPVPRSVLSSSLLFVHQELLDEVGMAQPRTADDLDRLFKELNRPQDKQWAVAGHSQAAGYGMNFFLQIFKGPNNWQLDKGGNLKKDIETEAYKATLSYVRQLVQADYFYPGSASISTNAAKTLFDGSRVATVFDSWSAYQGYWNRQLIINPKSKVRVMQLFGHDGGKPNYFFGTGNFGHTAIPKTSDKHLKLLLRVANMLAAPFGTTEQNLFGNGVEGVDFTFDAKGNPVRNARGQAEINVPLGYITGGPGVLYDAQDPMYASVAHGEEVVAIPTGVADPTLGLYSPTWSDQQATLTQLVTDGLNEILGGRRALSDFDQLVKDWRAQGGDTARKEFQQALHKTSR